MRTAKLADGRTLQFPDGTPDEVVQATVQRMLNPASPAPGVPALPQQTEQANSIGLRESGQQAAQGITLGFGDELTAGLAAPFAAIAGGVPVSEAFRDILEAERGHGGDAVGERARLDLETRHLDPRGASNGDSVLDER